MMNKRFANKLHKDLDKYSKQIGISSSHIPKLVTDRPQLRNALTEGYGETSNPNEEYYYTKSRAGAYFYGLDLIYVNCHQRYLKNHNEKEKIKPLAYSHFLGGLIHELVHYRFDELEHGPEFNQRIKEIIQGKTFPKWSKMRDD